MLKKGGIVLKNGILEPIRFNIEKYEFHVTIANEDEKNKPIKMIPIIRAKSVLSLNQNIEKDKAKKNEWILFLSNFFEKSEEDFKKEYRISIEGYKDLNDEKPLVKIDHDRFSIESINETGQENTFNVTIVIKRTLELKQNFITIN